MSNLFFFLFISFPLLGFNSPDYEPNLSLEDLAIEKRLNEADQNWNTLTHEIDAFLTFTNRSPLPQNEKESINTTIKEMQSDFLTFRSKLASCMIAVYGEGKSGMLGYSQATLELTNWYKQYVENQIFPINWELLFSSEQSTQKNELSLLKDQKN